MKSILVLYIDTSGNQCADVMDCHTDCSVNVAMSIMRSYNHVDGTKPMFAIIHPTNLVAELSVVGHDGSEIVVGEA